MGLTRIWHPHLLSVGIMRCKFHLDDFKIVEGVLNTNVYHPTSDQSFQYYCFIYYFFKIIFRWGIQLTFTIYEGLLHDSFTDVVFYLQHENRSARFIQSSNKMSIKTTSSQVYITYMYSSLIITPDNQAVLLIFWAHQQMYLKH